MKINIQIPASIHQQGKRTNNEDFLYPPLNTASVSDKLFVVCDGVGGADKGEEASKLATECFVQYFRAHPVDVPNEAYINDAFAYTHTQFEEYQLRNPVSRGMATTLTLIYLHEAGITVAHVGDSRVYHVKKNNKFWHTEDHSVVYAMYKQGHISFDDMERHPMKNQITRCIGGDTGRNDKPDVILLNDIEEGDTILLCSDGITESWSNGELIGLLKNQALSTMEIAQEIDRKCQEKSRDNFTAYILRVNKVEGMANMAMAAGLKVAAYQSFVMADDIELLDEAAPISENTAPQDAALEQSPSLVRFENAQTQHTSTNSGKPNLLDESINDLSEDVDNFSQELSDMGEKAMLKAEEWWKKMLVPGVALLIGAASWGAYQFTSTKPAATVDVVPNPNLKPTSAQQAVSTAALSVTDVDGEKPRTIVDISKEIIAPHTQASATPTAPVSPPTQNNENIAPPEKQNPVNTAPAPSESAQGKPKPENDNSATPEVVKIVGEWTRIKVKGGYEVYFEGNKIKENVYQDVAMAKGSTKYILVKENGIWYFTDKIGGNIFHYETDENLKRFVEKPGCNDGNCTCVVGKAKFIAYLNVSPPTIKPK